MQRNTKIVIGLLVVLAVAFLGLGFWVNAKKAKQTIAAVATVTGVKQASKRGQDDTIVLLSYPAGSVTAEGKARVSGIQFNDYPKGRQIRVCYDPADVTSMRMDDGPCG